jgi:hypothetical protein
LAACIALHVSGRLVSTGSNINRFIGRWGEKFAGS